MARSKCEPFLGNVAGVRLTVICRGLKGVPELRAAERTLSLASLTERSGSPRTLKLGSWEPMSVSTSTTVPCSPTNATDNALANRCPPTVHLPHLCSDGQSVRRACPPVGALGPAWSPEPSGGPDERHRWTRSLRTGSESSPVESPALVQVSPGRCSTLTVVGCPGDLRIVTATASIRRGCREVGVPLPRPSAANADGAAWWA